MLVAGRLHGRTLSPCPCPSRPPAYHPVPYGRFLEEIELHVPRFGLTVTDRRFALARDSNQMFGVLTCRNGGPDTDYALAIGVRNSYDRSLSVGLVAGARVFCCDNLAFSGEVQVARKHTVHVFRDLPDLIYRMLSQVGSIRDRTSHEIETMKATTITDERAHHLMVAAVRRRVVPASWLPKVIRAWDTPQHEQFEPRTAWSLYNAFTDVMKLRCARAQMEGGLRLSGVFREQVAR